MSVLEIKAGFATLSEVVHYLRLSPGMIKKLIKQGDLKAVKFGRALRIRWSDVEAMCGADQQESR